MENYRILFIISSLQGGGAENHLLNLCRHLKASAYSCAVCTLSVVEDGLERNLIEEGISLFRIPLFSLGDLIRPKSVVALRRIMHRFRPDIIHSHLFHAEIVAACASILSGVPAISTRHSSGLEFAWWRVTLIRCLRSRFKRIITVSRDAAREARRQGFPDGTVIVLPNAVDTRRFKPLEPGERSAARRSLFERYFPGTDHESCLLVGAVGGLKAVKNYPLFIRMAARLSESMSGDGSDVRYMIIGEGDERETLTALARTCGIGRILAMPGFLEEPERLYPLFDCYILPSLTEGVPLALLEAMASGVACIASDVGDVGVILADAGELVEPGDEDSFLRAASTLLTESDRRSELGRKARVRVLENFDTDIWGDKIVSIYNDLLG
ncbi:MAG: glycosyltransferase [bacterium]|nr:MAG: glycosyltransferase [bacterium]